MTISMIPSRLSFGAIAFKQISDLKEGTEVKMGGDLYTVKKSPELYPDGSPIIWNQETDATYGLLLTTDIKGKNLNIPFTMPYMLKFGANPSPGTLATDKSFTIIG